MSKIAVILLGMGGPDSLKAVEPFLFNLFSDPDIFKIPFGQKYFAKIISKLRTPKVIEQYKKIGEKSPQNYYTEQQRELLEKSLRTVADNVDVLVAMRYWHPLIEETANKIKSKNYDKVILLPLYPHFSSVTTGSSFNEWWRHCEKGTREFISINNFYNHPLYIAALNERIDEAIRESFSRNGKKVELLFSAHSVPQSFIDNGDPYQSQILETINLLMSKREEKYHVSYQSKVGPVKWLEPSTKDKITELGQAGVSNLLVVPISFVSDHIETLYELGVEYKHLATEVGISDYVVMQGLNDSPAFITLLHELVMQEIKNG